VLNFCRSVYNAIVFKVVSVMDLQIQNNVFIK